MALRVFPSDQDHGGGKRISEQQLAEILSWLPGFDALARPRNFIVSGLATNGRTGTSVHVTAGTAFINGRLVELDAQEDVVVDANVGEVQAWHLQLTLDGAGAVTGHQWVKVVPASGAVNTDGSDSPTHSVQVFVAQYESAASILLSDRRPAHGIVTGSYVGDGSVATKNISVGGRTPAMVIVSGDGQTGSAIFGISALNRTPGGSNPGFYASSTASGLASLKYLRPALEPYGFSVRHDAGATDSLNQNGIRYTYLAIFAGAVTA